MATKKTAPAKKTTAKPKLVAVPTVSSKVTHPLIVEPHPKDYSGFPFITLIQYRKSPMLVIVDNADDSSIKAFVLDLCGPEHVDEEMLISVAAEWYQDSRTKFPLSIEFSRKGLTPVTSKIYRALNIEFVSRVIGPVSKFPMNTVKSVKRRRRKPLPSGVVVSIEEFLE